jgi:hypothetical protein
MTGGAKAMQPEEVHGWSLSGSTLAARREWRLSTSGRQCWPCPADQPVTGREAIQAICQQMADARTTFAVETPLPTVRFEDLALTSTRSADNTRRAGASAAPPGRRLLAADHGPA